ncbi:MAG: hypothetical protein ACKO70_13175 [Actinomycetota bacterium]
MPAVASRMTALALITTGLLMVAGCASGDDEVAPAEPSTTMSMSMSTPTLSASPSATSSPGSSAATPSDASDAASPSASPAAVDPAYTVADAIVDQLNTIPPAALTSELVTIAVSPQLRQVASQYGVTTGIDVRGADVSISVESERLVCRVTVADPPETTLALSCKKRP